MSKLGLSVDEGTFTNAEMKAYAAAISLADEKMTEILKNVFISTAENPGIAMFLSMIGENPVSSAAQSKLNIISAVSDNRSIYTRSKYDSIVKAIGTANQSSYTVSGNIMDFAYGGNVNRPRFDDYSRLITDYNPCTVVINNNSGRTFSSLDTAAFRWFEIDRRSIPFETLDNMK